MAAFVDTNIVVYALSLANAGEIRKVAIAKRLVNELSAKHSLIISTQVLSEFISVASRKGQTPRSIPEIQQTVTELCKQTVIPVDATLVQQALHRVQLSRISYWDALIVEAALRSGADILYTEDMHHGIRYGSLEIRNPFL